MNILRFAGLLALSALSLLLVPRAEAAPPVQTVTHSVAVGPTALSNVVLNVPQFDPALGTLVSVRIDAAVDIQWTQSIEFMCSNMPGMGHVTYDNRSHTVLSRSGSFLSEGYGGTAGDLDAANTFDGTLDFAGPSGDSFSPPLQAGYALDSVTLTGTPARPYVGTGTVALDASLSYTANYASNQSGCASPVELQSNIRTYTVDVTYTFS